MVGRQVLRAALAAAPAVVLASALLVIPPAAVATRVDPARSTLSGSPSDLPTGPPAAVPAGTGTGADSEPSAEEVAAERERAQALLDEVTRRQGDVTDGRTKLDATTAAASLALERYRGAVTTARTAQLEADRQDQLLLQSQLVLAEQKAVVGRWARAAYGGGELASNPTLATILSGGSTDDLDRAQTYLQRVGNSKGRAVVDYTTALAYQAVAASAAAEAQAAAQEAAVEAKTAKEAADAAVSSQRDALSGLETELSQVQDAAADAQTRANNLAAARLIARARRGDGAGGSNAVTGAVGDCRGGDTSLYPNGEIPADTLCPVWGTASHRLRADAAYAFNRLSQAYAQEFGAPVCVTDSYRDYATQVQLYATKPGLAAVPGTSNHGWGTATDLCGGIQDFGTPTHRWMLQHAPEYGWFHPAWADADGSRPEPWHWEFAG